MAPAGTPPVPAGARGVFASERLPLVERYAGLLATDGVTRGLIGPREVPRLWDRHLMNSAALLEVLPTTGTVCDVGSGAGLPGLVIALARPDQRVTLLEPLLRRTRFLEDVVGDLGLENVEVCRGRAEELHGRRVFDVVTSRAVAPLGRLARWSMPLVAPTGVLLALKGSSVRAEVTDASDVLRGLGCAEPEVLELGRDLLAEPTWGLRVAWADPGKVGFPDAGRQAATESRSGSRRRRRS